MFDKLVSNCEVAIDYTPDPLLKNEHLVLSGFKPSIRLGRKGDLSDFKHGCWCHTGWSENVTNCCITGIFPHNHL